MLEDMKDEVMEIVLGNRLWRLEELLVGDRPVMDSEGPPLTGNKEINMDIEITPEEVLMVNKGLDAGVVRYLAWKIDGEQKRFADKIATIRKKLIQSFEQAGTDAKVLPIRFLLALEREAHIFLAIIGGKTATAVIREALKVYGNPASRIFSRYSLC